MHLRSLARSHTELALKVLCGIAQNSDNDPARVRACELILDRGWGRAPQSITGENGQGGIEVTIRHIVEGHDEERDTKMIEATPLRDKSGHEN